MSALIYSVDCDDNLLRMPFFFFLLSSQFNKTLHYCIKPILIHSRFIESLCPGSVRHCMAHTIFTISFDENARIRTRVTSLSAFVWINLLRMSLFHSFSLLFPSHSPSRSSFHQKDSLHSSKKKSFLFSEQNKSQKTIRTRTKMLSEAIFYGLLLLHICIWYLVIDEC